MTIKNIGDGNIMGLFLPNITNYTIKSAMGFSTSSKRKSISPPPPTRQ